MYRNIIEQLREWKNKEGRKPLILAGARQVGKTYILRKFGEEEFDNVVYVNCEDNVLAKNLFAQDYNMQRIVLALGAIAGQSIEAGKTLIILDEIQEAPRGLSVLKYFCENAPQYHVAVAGSLLGITMHRGESFPVGKVDILHIYPMTFDEFLLAKGNRQLVDILRSKDWVTIKLLKSEYIKALREYYFVGGMPEAVGKFIETNDAVKVREIQKNILYTYQKDISKHVPTSESNRINMVWQSMPSQLVKENKKFIYGVAKPGGRAKDFEVAIQWLMDAGLVYKVERVNEAKMPLKFYVDISSFKLFLLDCGLLGAMSETPPEKLLVAENGMEESKGAFTENYMMSQLVATHDTSVFYYSNDAKLEIDFLIQHGSEIVPIEAKAEENLRAKSLSTFVASHSEMHGLRFSMSDYREQDWMTNVPLYAITSYFLP
ncbi:ATP-binding protein [Bacteroides muris (ex Afrizal et al. 2022)]|mgnify:FL=1|uniref:ATP-binding protein n=1 Tax=Bacteroides muris (ex Afrizal et al. 2022) TaxID=2516960 RepID=A0A4S2AAX7_9BACE|nr:ATP-binding protein [Bacteroides muris (ex Afrizal et al. 2022)]TGX97896.1 ATP-binding protein [Bacteroides muris (ex Afrizal et al. 2022)]